MMLILRILLASCLFAGAAQAQALNDGEQSARVDIGSGFSVAMPGGSGWQAAGAPGAYSRDLGPEGHLLVLVAVTGPSGISRQDILAVGGPGGANHLVRLVSRFVERAWKAHAAGLEGECFETIEVANETGGPYEIGKFFCGYSRIRVRDRGALVDGVPAHLRYVGSGGPVPRHDRCRDRELLRARSRAGSVRRCDGRRRALCPQSATHAMNQASGPAAAQCCGISVPGRCPLFPTL